MILSWLILVLSTAMFFFCFQVTCQNILRRQFDREYFQSIVSAVRLEFLSLRRSVEEVGAPDDYSQLRMMLKCDFLALTCLLKNATNVKHCYSNGERFLILYFRWQLLSLALRHLLKVGEKNAILRLTAVLQYLANVVGEHVDTVTTGKLKAATQLENI